MCFSNLGVFLISVKPLTTENTENKTTPKICKITVFNWNKPMTRILQIFGVVLFSVFSVVIGFTEIKDT